jgi:hypothetical protein
LGKNKQPVQATVFKQSRVVIVKQIIFFEVLVMIFYFTSRRFVTVDDIHRLIPATSMFGEMILVYIPLLFLHIGLLGHIVASWYVHGYHVAHEELIEIFGVFVRKKVITQLKNIVSLSSSQGIIGKRLNYGTIALHLSGTEKAMTLPDIPAPDEVLNLLKQKTNAEIVPPPPFFSLPQIPRNELSRIISQGEHEKAEFKSSFRWDINLKGVNRSLEKAVMKTVAAFMNTEGGVLVIGITDKKTVNGILDDYVSLPKKNRDGFENHFNQVFSTAVGVVHRPHVTLSFHKHRGKELCIVTVKPNEKPVYVKTDGAEEFFIRTGNTTTSLQMSEASSYIKSHWSS